MNLFIISLITFLIPVGVLSVGLLDVYANRNTGVSRTLFSAFLFSLLSFFLFNLMTEVKMGEIQIVGFVILMPFSMLAGPLMLMYQKSLMGLKYKLLGTKNVLLHFVPFMYSIVVLFVGIIYFKLDEINEIFLEQKLVTGDNVKVVARIVLVSTHVLWYLQLAWYTRQVNTVYVYQKRKYGKFYAQFEEFNEKLMLREVIVLMMVACYDLMFWVVRVRSPYLMIMVNLSFGVALVFLIRSGREQIDIKRYRMYKLDSHENELHEAHPPKKRKKKAS